MAFFGLFTDPRQARIDALAYEVSALEETLAAEQKRSREKGRLASELLGERDAARIERDTAQRERDEYRERLLRFTAPRERGPGGRFMKVDVLAGKPRPNGAGASPAQGLS